jgi:hypothetical protein
MGLCGVLFCGDFLLCFSANEFAVTGANKFATTFFDKKNHKYG